MVGIEGSLIRKKSLNPHRGLGVMYPGLPMQPAAAGVRELMHRELSHSRELMHIGEMYHQCLLYAPLPTKAITNAGVYGTADLLQQVRGGKPIDKRRIWSFFVTGLGSGVLWACYYDVADYVVNAKPVTDVVGVGAVQRTIMSLAIQQFVWCPIMFSTYQIPAAVLQNGGKFSEIPGAVRERLLELLIKSAKIFTVADIVRPPPAPVPAVTSLPSRLASRASALLPSLACLRIAGHLQHPARMARARRKRDRHCLGLGLLQLCRKLR